MLKKLIFGIINYKEDMEEVKVTSKKTRYTRAGYFPSEYIAMDLEATGTSEFNYMIEISAIKISNGQIVEEFNTLVKPPKHRSYSRRRTRVNSVCMVNNKKIYYIDKFIENLTGINNRMIHSAPEEKGVIQKFYDFIQGYIIVGHGVGNDLNIINSTFNRVLKKDLKNQYIDTFVLGEFLDSKEYSLVNLCNRFEIDNKSIHRARSDAYRTYLCYERILQELISKYGKEKVDTKYNDWATLKQKIADRPKVLKRRTMKILNNKYWNAGYQDLIESGNLVDLIDGMVVTICPTIAKRTKGDLINSLALMGADVNEKVSMNTQVYISDVEINEDNIDLNDLNLKKVININKKGKRIKIMNLGLIKKFINNEYNPYFLIEDEEEMDMIFEGKNFYIYNECLELKEKKMKDIIEKKGGKIVDVLDKDTNWIIAGEGLEGDPFIDTEECDKMVSLISMGCDILVSNEKYFMSKIGM